MHRSPIRSARRRCWRRRGSSSTMRRGSSSTSRRRSTSPARTSRVSSTTRRTCSSATSTSARRSSNRGRARDDASNRMKLGFYAGRRVLLLVPVLLGVTFITFALTRIIPGDPIALVAGPYVSAERKAEIRHSLFLDRPFYVQYVHYVDDLLH